ncbi:MAG: acetolactate synthase large subunit [Chloroflexota bacterium]
MTTQPTNGAQNLIRTLLKGGVDVCFTNPGTSEMHFVAALDQVEGMRAILCLFEGVCTGAADGYARMTGKPASTLLHLGPGLGNGIANLHNARRARSPMVNVVGEHATYHIQYDAPLTSDIEGLAWPQSAWVRTSQLPDDISRDTADAITAANTYPGQIATLILPGDTSWNPTDVPITVPKAPSPPSINHDAVQEAARLLRSGEPTALYIAGQAVLNEGAQMVSRIAKATRADVKLNRFTGRRQLGAGRPIFENLAYVVPTAVSQLEKYKNIILVGSDQPVAFFAYPNNPSLLASPDSNIHSLATPQEDSVGALAALADELNVPDELGAQYEYAPLAKPTGELSLDAIWLGVIAQLPEQAIMINEALTSARPADKWLPYAKPFDMIQGTGGSIGHGLPESVGAAVACPDRQVIDMQADGSALYTIQSLWTMARENLNIVVVLFNNRAYRILQGELQKVGAKRTGNIADTLLNLDNPQLDFVSIAQGMGVEASRAETADSFNDQLTAALAKSGPHLIEVLV